MEGIFFQIERRLGKYMSRRASLIFSGLGTFALFLLGLWGISLKGFKESSDTILYLCFIIFLLIPISIIISWVFDLKHLIDMRVVTAYFEDPEVIFPQNAIHAKKQGLKYRRISKKEREMWGLKKQFNFKSFMRDLIHVTQEDLENRKKEERLYDPDIPMEEYRRIREEQDRRKKGRK